LILSWWAVGMVELSLGNFRAADQEFERIGKIRDQLPGAPSFLCYWADRVEALVGAGRLDEAERVADFFDELTERGPFDWPRALGLRCRAMVSAARGDVEAALESVDIAETLLRQDPHSPFELARTLLVSGEIRRRARRKREASERLEQAHAIFDRLGATIWAARARSELDRVGIRPPAPLELTRIEREVARLAASGMTNREVAAAVFVTPKTVEGVLSRVYGKLGIRTRAQLGGMLRPPDAVDVEAGPEHRGA
jgi:DNA-binding CsgD family transcriptional regulator